MEDLKQLEGDFEILDLRQESVDFAEEDLKGIMVEKDLKGVMVEVEMWLKFDWLN